VAYALKEVSTWAQEQSLDPWAVMVTKVDADSVFAPRYLEQLAVAYDRQLDGRRVLYKGPYNAYRNYAESSWLICAEALSMCHEDTFKHDERYYTFAQVSGTLGFCQELGFWGPPDEISEDYAQSWKAMLVSGSNTVVRKTWSLVLSDQVGSLTDRYTQSVRWAQGITQACWCLAFVVQNKLDGRSSSPALAAAWSNATSYFIAPFLPVYGILVTIQLVSNPCLSQIHVSMIVFLIVLLLSSVVIDIFTEIMLWRTVLHRPRPSYWRLVLMPVLSRIFAPFYGVSFSLLPGFHVAIECWLQKPFTFIRTPKGEFVQ